MREIEIIGGGLAGLSLGIYLRKLGVGVKIYESGNYPKHKVCGEFICGVDPQILSEMGLGNIMEDSEHHHDMSWWMNGSLVMQERLPQVAWGLSRYKLDEDLAQKFTQAGGELVTKHRVKFDELTQEGVVYGVGKRKNVSAKEAWIGLKIHAVDVLESELSGLEMHVGERGYIGLCGVENQRVNCCGLFRLDKSLKGNGSELLMHYLQANGLSDLAEKLKRWELDETSFSATAGFSLGAQEKVGAFCIGDALHLIPPFTGNGMSMALESSYLAGAWLARYAKGELDWHQAHQGYDTEATAFFSKRMKVAQGIHPMLFHRISRSALKLSAQTGVLPFNYLFTQLRTP